MHFLVVNGPNLNLLGTREPDVYGSETLADLERLVSKWGTSMGVDVTCAQSNHEGELIDLIQTFDGDGIVINPGGLTHTSHAIADAIRSVDTPVVEVHISNIREREPWRAASVISPAAVRAIYGRGIVGYRNGMRHLVNRTAVEFETVSYGPHHDNVGDLRRGGDDLVVLAHGGLWQHRFERDTVESLAVDLTRRGFDTWNVEYRRLGDGGGWPGSGHDLLTALDYIPQLGLDPGRVVIVSHSAGSQLATWAAERSHTTVDLHIAMSPLIDLQAAIDNDDVGAEESRRLIGRGAPSPTIPDRVDTVIVHGESDQIVPVERSVALAYEHTLELERPECDHFGLLDPTRPHWEWVIDRIGATT